MVKSIALLTIAFAVQVFGRSHHKNTGNASAPVVIYTPHANPFHANKSIIFIHGVKGRNVSLPQHKSKDQRRLATKSTNSLSPELLDLLPSDWKQQNARGQLKIEIPDTEGSPVTIGEDSDEVDQPEQPHVQPQQPQQPPPTTPPFLPDVPDIPNGTCGQTMHDPMSDARIVGGKEATRGTIPWLVRLDIAVGQGFMIYCGGTLLRVNDKVQATDIVLTAAHCFAPEKGHLLNESTVIAGGHDRDEEDSPEDQRVDMSQFISHELWGADNYSKNDFAIVKLAEPIKFGKTVQPACLPKADEKVPEGTVALAAGWGYTKEGGQGSTKLKQVKLPIVSFQTCNEHYQNIIDKTQICAGYPQGGQDTCQGDSGGPLLVPTRQGYVLQGVVSVGDGCARPGVPGIYSRVSGYIDWINNKIKQYSDVAKQTA